MRFVILKILAAAIILPTLLLGGVEAQNRNIDERAKNMAASANGHPTVRLAYAFDNIKNLSGGQFRIHYDSDLFAVSDTSECLANLPETHQSAFSACQVNEDKSFIQFIVLDLGKNRPIGNSDLGYVEFSRISKSSRKSLLAGRDPFHIKDVKLAGPDGNHLNVKIENQDAGGLNFRVLE